MKNVSRDPKVSDGLHKEDDLKGSKRYGEKGRVEKGVPIVGSKREGRG